MKTIWIINDYAGSKYHGMEFRNYYLAKEWLKKGYKAYIITASYSHLFNNLPKVKGNFTFENIDGINYIWIKVPKYKSSTDKMRVLKWFIFTFKLFLLPVKNLDRPDVIIASPMAPFLVLPAYKLARQFDAKFIFEVKDIWPLSIIELGDISPKHPLIRMMGWCERFAIKKADIIVSSLQNYGEYLRNNLQIDKDFIWINNGIDLDEIKNIEPLSEEIQVKIPKNKFIIGYTGAIGIANALDVLLEAAKSLEKYEDIVFVLVGDGKEKEKLINRYGNLKNVLFIGPVKKTQIQSILKFFDVCYIGLRKEKLFQYGVSPNKLFDYMFAGKPIVYAIDSGKSNLVKLANCGITVEAENPESVAKGILELYYMPEEKRKQMGQKGKKYVLENFTYQKLAEEYEKLF